MTQYRQVPTQVDLPALEHEVLQLWHDNKIFTRSLEQTEGRPEWVFYEGPPQPTHAGRAHIEARVVKEYSRLQDQAGYTSAARRGGLPRPPSRSSEKERGSKTHPTSRPTA